MKKIIFFDLDGTVTKNHTRIEKENKNLLDELSKKYKLVMVSAGAAERVFLQLGEYPVDIIGNYGMQEGKVIDGKFKITKKESLKLDIDYFKEKCNYIREKYGYTDFKGESIKFFNTGMATFPLLGTDADIEEKLNFDPDRKKRKLIYPEIVQIFSEYNVYIGGTSSFDFSGKDYNKYTAVMSYAEKNGYSKDEMLFVGDDFCDGGGDSHIRLGGIDYIEVKNYRNLRKDLEYLL